MHKEMYSSGCPNVLKKVPEVKFVIISQIYSNFNLF